MPVMVAAAEFRRLTASGDVPKGLPEINRDKVFVVKAAELNDGIAVLARIQKFTAAFEVILLAKGEALAEQERLQLCNEPEVAAALSRIRARQNAP
jgi:hypothetical protein